MHQFTIAPTEVAHIMEMPRDFHHIELYIWKVFQHPVARFLYGLPMWQWGLESWVVGALYYMIVVLRGIRSLLIWTCLVAGATIQMTGPGNMASFIEIDEIVKLILRRYWHSKEFGLSGCRIDQALRIGLIEIHPSNESPFRAANKTLIVPR
jgi:hypothetical protein